MVFMPRRWARGAKMFKVSVAIRTCLSGRRNPRVRMLWSRSASLMTRTRTSSEVAMIILRMVSALAVSP